MSTIETASPPATQPPPTRRQSIQHTLRSWLTTWEIYPILLVASFTHFYQLATTEFDFDQAQIFGMARTAVVHGLLPATSNLGSQGTAHLPLAIFLYMIPAAISANPLGGAILVALFNVLADLLTYVFVRRHFGRVAGIIAALLYSTAVMALLFGRFIWQPTLMAPFVVLFFFALFWGVVEQRKGWLFPALLLLGVLVQLHETMGLMIVPLLLAIAFAPQTIRWRDLALGLLSLLILFSTYLAWLVVTHFHDVTVLLSASKQPSYFDPLVFTYYRDFFSPYMALAIPSDPHTLMFQLLPVLIWLRRLMLYLVFASFVTALIRILLGYSFFAPAQKVPAGVAEQDGAGETKKEPAAKHISPWSRVSQWWNALLPSPLARGLILLVVWQAVFLLFLSRHTRALPLVPHYFIPILPGPFILVGIFAGSLANWLQAQRAWLAYARFALYLFMALILVMQFVGSTAWLLDQVSQQNQVINNHHSLSSLQRALSTADALAQQQHLNHVYVSSGFYTQDALQYLTPQMRTPTTVYDETSCLVLPNPADGPAALLVGPGDSMTPALLARYGSVIGQPVQDVSPFHLYIVRPVPLPDAAGAGQTFAHELRSLDGRAQRISAANGTFLTSAWSFLKGQPASYPTNFVYLFSATLNGSTAQGQPAKVVQSRCALTSIRAGDELVVAFSIPANAATPTSAGVAARFHIEQPARQESGPFQLESYTIEWVNDYALQTTSGGNSVTLSGS